MAMLATLTAKNAYVSIPVASHKIGFQWVFNRAVALDAQKIVPNIR